MHRPQSIQTIAFWTLTALLMGVIAYEGAILAKQQPAPEVAPAQPVVVAKPQPLIPYMSGEPYRTTPRPIKVAHSPVERLPRVPLDARVVFDGTPLLAQVQEASNEPALVAPRQVDVERPVEVGMTTVEPATAPTEQFDELATADEAPMPATMLNPPARAYDVEEFDEAAQLAANTSMEDMLAYFPAEDELSEQFRPRVQQAFTLARNGALHAARGQFEQLLTELARAKDASHMTDRHSRALKAGLRALAEADDFVACDEQTGAPARMAIGHQTPMLHEADAKWVLPHEAIAMYHLYAQQKLAAAVQGEQAGSMLLFGLGKTYAHIAERDEQPQAIRKSLTMYRSAVGAHGQNYLAANEAGVILARSGRYAQAAPLLEMAARMGNASTTHRNLAYVHNKLGDQQLAASHQQLADQLAQQEIARGQLSAERGIAWVSPDQFNRSSQQSAGAPAAIASRPVASPSIPAPTSSPATPPASNQPSANPTFWW